MRLYASSFKSLISASFLEVKICILAIIGWFAEHFIADSM